MRLDLGALADVAVVLAAIALIATAITLAHAAGRWLDRRRQLPYWDADMRTQACALGVHDRCSASWCRCDCHTSPPDWVNQSQPQRPHHGRCRRSTWKEDHST